MGKLLTPRFSTLLSEIALFEEIACFRTNLGLESAVLLLMVNIEEDGRSKTK